MKDIVVRRAKIEEVEIIQQLNNELINYEMEEGFDTYIKDWALSDESRDYFLDLIQNQFVVVAEVEGKIVGYLAGSIYNDLTYSYYEGLTAEANNMFVIKEYRAFGIGRKLMNSFIEWCKQNNAKRVMVTASSKNEKTIKFYHNCGFEDINLTLRKDL